MHPTPDTVGRPDTEIAAVPRVSVQTTQRRSASLLRAGSSSSRRCLVLLVAVTLCVIVLGACSLGGGIGRPGTPQVTAVSDPATTPLGDSPGPTETPTPQATGIPPTVLPSPQPEMAVEATATVPSPTSTPRPAFFEGPIIYGQSFDGRPLEAYRLGYGPSVRAIIGGIHGGYEWNTVTLVNYVLSYLKSDPGLIPESVTLYIIPNMNPDGYAAGTDAVVARMNGNGVDLNRNWDYQWQPTATHGTREVKAGTAPFSEPETAATRDFILGYGVEAVIFYHSAMGVVFSGADAESSATVALAEMLSDATGYPHRPEGVPGQITTGDAIDYLSTQGIAGAEIELTSHSEVDDAERQQNLDGIIAFLNWTVPDRGHSGPTPAPVEGEWGQISYTVQAGDTLSGIADAYGLRLEDLLYLNDIEDVDQIREGDVLLIPVLTEE